MIRNVPVDQYKLVLEGSSANGIQRVRAVATNTATQLTTETSLSPEQTRALIELAYGSEQMVVENQLEHVGSGYMIPLLSNGKDSCIFTTNDLIRFGFDPDELAATKRPMRSHS